MSYEHLYLHLPSPLLLSYLLDIERCVDVDWYGGLFCQFSQVIAPAVAIGKVGQPHGWVYWQQRRVKHNHCVLLLRGTQVKLSVKNSDMSNKYLDIQNNCYFFTCFACVECPSDITNHCYDKTNCIVKLPVPVEKKMDITLYLKEHLLMLYSHYFFLPG